MHCQDILAHIDDYLDRQLDVTQLTAFHAHIKQCPSCHQALEDELRLIQRLRTLPVPPPSEGFFDRALAQAQLEGARQHRRHWGFALGGAMAASLALVVAINTLQAPLPVAGHDELPGISISLNQVHQVKLVFDAETQLHNATLTLRLPQGVEVPGFPGQQVIAWQTDLKQGKNLLNLPVIARDVPNGELEASVEHANRHKSYRIHLGINPERSTALPAAPGKMT